MIPVGLTARPVQVSGSPHPDGPDVDLAHRVILEAERSALGESHMPRETVRSLLTSPEVVHSESRLLLDEHGAAQGLFFVEWEPEADRAFLNTYATPEYAKALQPALLDACLAAVARHRPDRPWAVEAAAFEQDAVLQQALRDAGFARVRRFWRLRVDFDGPVTAQPPDGVSLRVASGEEDRRLLHTLFERSFAQHYGFAARPYEDWIGWFDARGDARVDLRWIAELQGDPVALCIADDSRIDEGLTYIRTLGVAPEARGRGIARWLLLHAFAQAQREGRTGAALAVDSDNSTGATALYESVGMRPTQVIELFSRPL